MGPGGTQDHRGPHKTSKKGLKTAQKIKFFENFFFYRWAQFYFLIAFKHYG